MTIAFKPQPSPQPSTIGRGSPLSLWKRARERGTLKNMALACTLALTASPLWAHTKLLQQNPAANASVTAPAKVQLEFSEALEPAFSSIHLLTAQGEEVTLEKAVVDNAAPKTLSVAVPKLAPGSYTVKWSVVAKDGHRSKNSYSFSVKP